MADIVTLTINPSIDTSTAVDRMAPIHKLRCAPPHRDPGGGGVNVARVAVRFGADVKALCAAGGVMGELLRRLIHREGIPNLVIQVSEETRESFTVFEEATGHEYRFVLPGPELREEEWRQFLGALAGLEDDPRFIVASGSLSPGTPSGFYGHVARIAKQRGAKVVLDASGPPLAAALEEGVYLNKPNLRELSELMDVSLEGEDAWVDACRQLTTTGRAEFVALTLGDRGALLVARDHAWRAPALPIKPVSTVGVIAESSQNRTLRAVGALTSSSSHDLDCQLLA
ncbi:1-phosphofructokinase family hexose kinase (plasmid) [Methylocystis rosea]|uniref:Phosphofructokinase n=2 Tax=Methylocystis rosea TaxID=173366 RepID=A0A3G8MBJ0_9HYPH|nr:1-phosphofructokinase family hexose kinase [Methylocystis rosea]